VDPLVADSLRAANQSFMVASCLQLNVCCLDLFWDLYFPVLYIAKLGQVFPWHTLYTCTSMMTTAKCTSMSPSVILQQSYRALLLTCCSSTKCRLVSRGLALVGAVGTCCHTLSLHIFQLQHLHSAISSLTAVAYTAVIHCCLAHHTAVFGRCKQSRRRPRVSSLELVSVTTSHPFYTALPVSYMELILTIVLVEGVNNHDP